MKVKKRARRGQGMVRLHHGSWEARIGIKGSMFIQGGFDKEEQAWDWIANRKSDHVRGVLEVKPKEPKTPKVTFGDLAALLIIHKTTTHHRPWRPDSARFAREHLNARLLPAFGDRFASEITTEELQSWLEAQHGQKCLGRHKGVLSASTVRKIESVLSMVFRFGVKTKRIPSSPMAGVERTSVETDDDDHEDARDGPMRILTPDEIRQILIACPRGRIRAFFSVLALTGLRRLEIFRMRWNWIRFEKGVLRIRKAKRKSSRFPLSERLARELRELGPGAPNDLVFPGFSRNARRGDRGDRQKQLTDMRGPLRDVLASAGVDPSGVGLHTFRRSFATAIEDLPGVRLSHVIALLRHSRKGAGTTAVYLHPSRKRLLETLGEYERLIFGDKILRLLTSTASNGGR